MMTRTRPTPLAVSDQAACGLVGAHDDDGGCGDGGGDDDDDDDDDGAIRVSRRTAPLSTSSGLASSTSKLPGGVTKSFALRRSDETTNPGTEWATALPMRESVASRWRGPPAPESCSLSAKERLCPTASRKLLGWFQGLAPPESGGMVFLPSVAGHGVCLSAGVEAKGGYVCVSVGLRAVCGVCTERAHSSAHAVEATVHS
eukprot:758933-Pleurochrysis_carterae.AAC.1